MSAAGIEAVAERRNEFRSWPSPRCGFCGKIVDGDCTGMATPSEAFAAHPDAFVRGVYDGKDRDYEVYACEDECV